MVSPFCWSCLSTTLRPAARAVTGPPSMASSVPNRLRIASFHTTVPRYKSPLQKKSRTQDAGPKFRVTRSARIKKKSKRERAKPPAIGERKALRKRIVLSNTNALEVTGMADMSAENIVDARLRGQVVGLPVPLLDRLRAVQAFKPNQGWNMFRRPGVIVRKETSELARLFDDIGGQGAGKGKTVKRILGGERGSGKSVHLLQAKTMAFLKNWVVVNIPEAQDLVLAHTSYAPIEGSNPTQYVQKDATAELLARIVGANGPILSELHVSQDHSALPATVPADMTLEKLASLGASDPELAWPVFQAMWAELNAKAPAAGVKGIKEFKARPPMLVTVDGLSHWMMESKYRSAEFEPVHAHDLALVNHFLSLLPSAGPKSALSNGGIILYALSNSNRPTIYTFDLALKQLAARGANVPTSSPEFPQPEPYQKKDQRVLDLFNAARHSSAQEARLELQELKGLSREEARGLMEYYAQSGILREKVNDDLVGEKWTLAGGGLVGELEKLGRRLRAMAV